MNETDTLLDDVIIGPVKHSGLSWPMNSQPWEMLMRRLPAYENSIHPPRI
jgi:hypothetical protein